MRKRTNVLSIPLMAALLLALAGCGEQSPEEKFAELQKEAEAGNAYAQARLGGMYRHGEGVPKDAAKAIEWYQKAAALGHAEAQTHLGVMEHFAKLQKEAEAGNAEAQFTLGMSYRNLIIFNEEGAAAKAVEWWQKAAAQGYADASYNLGLMYAYGFGVPKDAAKAIEWYQKAAALGHAEAQAMLRWMYDNGEVVPKDAAEAFEWYQKAAAQGDAEAQVRLGSLYVRGEGVPKDDAKAFEWYQKAAAQGRADAQVRLGSFYILGEGVPKDDAKAFEWLQKAAAQGGELVRLEVVLALKLMYRNGEGVPKDDAKAVEWYQKAAALGLSDAQVEFGDRYRYGKGVPKDAAKAVEWYQKAAAQGNARAQYVLGYIYSKGEGVPRDGAKAVEWFQMAAAQGDPLAQFKLGVMYLEGRDGVTRDLVRAYAWLNLAAVTMWNMPPVLNPRVALERVEAMLTPAQRAEGQRLASNWKEGDTLQASNDSQPGQTSVGGTPSKQSTGTAFAVSTSGHALTNHHVINGCTEVKVAGREGIVKVITSDSVNDLALLQLPGKIKDIATLNPDPAKLRQGEDIIVFGYPLNAVLSSGGNLTPGTISALTGLGNNTNQIQITAAIQPGSSGSPVLDKQGNVIGVVSMKLDDVKTALATGSIPQNVNFAVNGQTVKAFLDANKVPYKTGGGFFSREKSNADIAEQASKWSVLVECWK